MQAINDRDWECPMSIRLSTIDARVHDSRACLLAGAHTCALQLFTSLLVTSSYRAMGSLSLSLDSLSARARCFCERKRVPIPLGVWYPTRTERCWDFSLFILLFVSKRNCALLSESDSFVKRGFFTWSLYARGEFIDTQISRVIEIGRFEWERKKGQTVCFSIVRASAAIAKLNNECVILTLEWVI